MVVGQVGHFAETFFKIECFLVGQVGKNSVLYITFTIYARIKKKL